MSGRNRSRTPSNASNSTSKRSTSTLKKTRKKKNNEIFDSRNESDGNDRAYSEKDRDCRSIYDETPKECSPATGRREPVASTIFPTRKRGSSAESTAACDIRNHQHTAVLALSSKFTIAGDRSSVKNPILLGDIGISVGSVNDENNCPSGSSVESEPGVEENFGENGGIEIKDYSPQSDELDVDYLSFSSTPSSIFPFYYPSPLFVTVGENVERSVERNEGENSNDLNCQEISDSGYDSDSSMEDSSGMLYLHLSRTQKNVYWHFLNHTMLLISSVLHSSFLSSCISVCVAISIHLSFSLFLVYLPLSSSPFICLALSYLYANSLILRT